MIKELLKKHGILTWGRIRALIPDLNHARAWQEITTLAGNGHVIIDESNPIITRFVYVAKPKPRRTDERLTAWRTRPGTTFVCEGCGHTFPKNSPVHRFCSVCRKKKC